MLLLPHNFLLPLNLPTSLALSERSFVCVCVNYVSPFPRKVQPRTPQLAASSCSGQSTLRSDRASGRSSSAQWWGDSSPGWASGLKKLQLTHILATVTTPALCKDATSPMRKRITTSFSSGEEVERLSSTAFAHDESPLATSSPAGVRRSVTTRLSSGQESLSISPFFSREPTA